MRLRGYAAPFNAPQSISGGHETLQGDCFDNQIKRNFRCVLQGDTHDRERNPLADSHGSSLRLFADEYGLGFEADVDPDHPALADLLDLIATGACGCSVHFVQMVQEMFDGVYIIEVGVIDHIALTPTPTYEGTACWDADNVPPHLAYLAEAWEQAGELV